MTPTIPHVSRISIGRVYNLGNYEHIRYELTIDIPQDASASTCIVAAERIIEGMRPDRTSKTQFQLDGDAKRIAEMRTISAAAFERQYGNPVGGIEAYIQRCEEAHAEEVAKRKASMAQQKRIRELFDDLGGASQYKDAKLNWDDDYNPDYEQ